MVQLYADMSARYQNIGDSTRLAHFPFADRTVLYATFEAMRNVNRPDQMDWRRATSVWRVAEIIDFVPFAAEPLHDFFVIRIPPTGGDIDFGHGGFLFKKFAGVLRIFEYGHLLDSDDVQFSQSVGLRHSLVDKSSIYAFHIGKADQLVDGRIITNIAF